MNKRDGKDSNPGGENGSSPEGAPDSIPGLVKRRDKDEFESLLDQAINSVGQQISDPTKNAIPPIHDSSATAPEEEESPEVTREAIELGPRATTETAETGVAGVSKTVEEQPHSTKDSEIEISLDWNVGDLILDTYEVTGELGEGTFGKVFKVHHRDWDMDMAVKVPRPDKSWTQSHKENFVRECHTWMDLGLHPHIVTCHYVRVLGNEKLPCVFAEFIEGGSLDDWIREERLYEGGQEVVLERILDIAIQFARGLQYAHDKGLVHQDVKPANVLIAQEVGSETATNLSVKVSDFGLAKAHTVPEEGMITGLNSALVSGAKGTPAYRSPEQAQGKKLNHQTDIWSWALSVLEMFTGEVTWREGQAAREVLEDFLDQGARSSANPSMPDALATLLKQCFQQSPEDRPENLDEIAMNLKEVYRVEVGRHYSNEAPTTPTELSDVLNNKALSFLELGMESKTEEIWQEALRLDPLHVDSVYNAGLYEWRSAKILDVEVVRRMEEVRKSHESDWRDEYLLGLVHLERGDGESARVLLEEAVKESRNAPEVVNALTSAREIPPTSERIYEGNGRANTSVALSQDGRWAISGSDHTLRFWDLAQGQCMRTFEDQSTSVNSVALSSDGCWALSGGYGWDKTLQLWETATGRCVRTFRGHKKAVESVALSADGFWAVSGSEDKTIRLWEVATGRCVRTLVGHGHLLGHEVGYGTVASVVLSTDGRCTLSGSWDKTVKLWENATGRCVQTFSGHKDFVESVALSTDGRWALSGSDDGTLRLWEVATGQCVRTIETSKGRVTSVALFADGRWALSGNADKTLCLWEVFTGRCMRTFEGHTNWPKSIAVSMDGRRVLSGGMDNTIRLWNVPVQKRVFFAYSRVIPVLETLQNQHRFSQFLSESRHALAVGRVTQAIEFLNQARQVPGCERHVDLLDLGGDLKCRASAKCFRGGWLQQTFEGHTQKITSLVLSADGCWALSGSADSTMRLWEVATGRCVRTFEGHAKSVISVALCADGKRAFSASSDKTVRLWEISTGKCVQTFRIFNFEGNEDHDCDMALSSDGRWVLSGKDDKIIRLLEVATGLRVQTFQGHQERSRFRTLSADGRWALTGSEDKTIKLWEIATGRCVRTFEGHTDTIQSVALSACGRWMLSGSADNTLRLWEVATGRCLRTLEGHTDRFVTSGQVTTLIGVTSVALSVDGKWALSGGGDENLRLWEVSTGRCVRTFEGHTGNVSPVALSADGRWALSGSRDNTLRLWELDWELEAVDPADWDEGARPYLQNFLTLHTPYAVKLPEGWGRSEEEITASLTRKGKPSWTENDFKQLLYTLGCAGYGWLRPEGVKKELEKMAADWEGPPPLLVDSPANERREEPQLRPEQPETAPAITISRPKADHKEPAETAELRPDLKPKAASSKKEIQDLLQKMIGRAPKAPPQIRIAGYEIGRMIGRTGMCAMHEGKKLDDGRPVVIKTLATGRSPNKKDRPILERELAIGRKWKHPNLIEFVDGGTQSGVSWIAMEHVENGLSLQRLLDERGGTIPLSEAIGFSLQILRGLAYVHENGIVHRDIKPANILLVPEGTGYRAKIMCFELAVFYGSNLGDTTIEPLGGVCGTPPYMPREHLVNKGQVRPTGDVFAMGATIYTSLTGQLIRDFPRGVDPFKTILEKPQIPLVERDPSIPEPIVEVVDKALSEKPQDRYQDGNEMKRGLDQAAARCRMQAYQAPSPTLPSHAESCVQPSFTFCTNCGVKMKEKSLFCTNCGKRIA